MSESVIVIIEHDRGTIASGSLEALTAARTVGADVMAAVCGGTDALAAACAGYGATVVVDLVHPLLDDYNPQAWGEAVAQLVAERSPTAVIACGTERGNETLAHVAASLDLPMVANALRLDNSAEASWTLTRVQWGGSLLEDVTLTGDVKLVSVSHHAVEMQPLSVTEERQTFAPALNDELIAGQVCDRVVRESGVTLTTAPVVVGGGRGVGSPEGFAPLEELAGLLGGVVGCSRAVTNNGWRNHTDQVGQTGTRIAPDIYFACGISGAIQHWVGAMASKKILAINIDKDANMVTRADYAVIGDLHQVIPAISEEIRRRRSA